MDDLPAVSLRDRSQNTYRVIEKGRPGGRSTDGGVLRGQIQVSQGTGKWDPSVDRRIRNTRRISRILGEDVQKMIEGKKRRKKNQKKKKKKKKQKLSTAN